MSGLSSAWPPVYDPAYHPDPADAYWNHARETMSVDQRDATVLEKLRGVVAWAWERAPFYQTRWRAAGFEPGDLRSLDDFAHLPVITKADLRADQIEHPPFGSYLCVDRRDLVRIHGTSGTSGRPTAFAWSRDDYARIADAHARIAWSFGLRPSDTVFIASIFSLYVGSWGALAGIERLGATAFPFGAGIPGQTLQAVSWIREMRPTAFYGTPSYALRLAETARDAGVDPATLGLRIMFFSGEPGAGIAATKQLIESTFGASCIDTGSMGEMTPWMNVAECNHRTGMHSWQDIVYAQVCDPETHRPVPFGAAGTPIYTHLERTCQPMIRLVSGDLAEWTDAPCPCGRTYPRFPRGIIGRLDDMLVIRGENVYPSAIEGVLRTFANVGEFEIVITRERHMDELAIVCEVDACAADDLSERIALGMRAKIGLRPKLSFTAPGSLGRTDLKSRRVRDER